MILLKNLLLVYNIGQRFLNYAQRYTIGAPRSTLIINNLKCIQFFFVLQSFVIFIAEHHCWIWFKKSTVEKSLGTAAIKYNNNRLILKIKIVRNMFHYKIFKYIITLNFVLNWIHNYWNWLTNMFVNFSSRAVTGVIRRWCLQNGFCKPCSMRISWTMNKLLVFVSHS